MGIGHILENRGFGTGLQIGIQGDRRVRGRAHTYRQLSLKDFLYLERISGGRAGEAGALKSCGDACDCS